MLDGTSSYGIVQFTGVSVKEYQVLAAGARNELRNSKLRLYVNFYFVDGQKTLDAAN